MEHKRLAELLAVEVCKDLDYYVIYKFAEKFLSLKFKQQHTVESLQELYGERYEYLFDGTIT